MRRSPHIVAKGHMIANLKQGTVEEEGLGRKVDLLANITPPGSQPKCIGSGYNKENFLNAVNVFRIN